MPGSSINTNTNSNNPTFDDKYITLTFKYKEKKYDGTKFPSNATNFVRCILDTVFQYNFQLEDGCSRFDVFGIYVDPDEVPIDKQNELNTEIKSQINQKD